MFLTIFYITDTMVGVYVILMFVFSLNFITQLWCFVGITHCLYNFLWKLLLKSFAHILIGIFIFLFFFCKSWPYNLEIKFFVTHLSWNMFIKSLHNSRIHLLLLFCKNFIDKYFSVCFFLMFSEHLGVFIWCLTLILGKFPYLFQIYHLPISFNVSMHMIIFRGILQI